MTREKSTRGWPRIAVAAVITAVVLAVQPVQGARPSAPRAAQTALPDGRLLTPAEIDPVYRAKLRTLADAWQQGTPMALEEMNVLASVAKGLPVASIEIQTVVSRAMYDAWIANIPLDDGRGDLLRRYMDWLKDNWATVLGRSETLSGYAAPRRPDASDDWRLYADPRIFYQLSGAGQRRLEAFFGPKAGNAPSRAAQGGKRGTAAPGLAPANVLVNDNAGATATSYFTQSETTIVLGASTVVAGFNDSGSYATGSKFTGWATSNDGGASFTDRGTLPTPPNNDAGDPVLARDTTTGRIYFSTLYLSGTGLNVFRSDDDGVSFPNVSNGVPSGFTGFQDKEWIAVDNFAGSGNGTVYLMWRSFGTPAGIFINRSTDHGVTWTSGNGGAAIFAGGQGAYVAVGPDHSVYAFYFDGAIRVRRSTDQGATFGPATLVTTLVTAGVNGDLGLSPGFRSNAFPHVAVNPVSGHLYVVYNDRGASTDKADAYFRMSTDNGATWSAATRVNTDATLNDQFFPTIAVAPDGTQLFITWYDRRDDPSNLLIHKYGRVGFISGGSVGFNPDEVITTQSFPAVFGVDSVVNTTYMGDYDMAVADANFFYTTWGDNRNPLGTRANQPDVFFAKVARPGSGVSSLIFTSSALAGGNGDQSVDPDECFDVAVTLSNVGAATATGITATLSTTTPGVTVQQASSTYPDIGVGASATNATPFTVETSPAFVCGTPVTFTISVTSSGSPNTFTFTRSSGSGGADYFTTTSTGAIDPGTTFVAGTNVDDAIVTIALPFPYSYYGSSFSSIVASTNGTVAFTAGNAAYSNTCLPSASFNNAIFAYWDDLLLTAAGNGIYTSVTGTAPNRVFNVEWRSVTFSGATPVNVELQLYEGTERFDVVYAATASNGLGSTTGCQQGAGTRVTQFSCEQATLTPGLRVSYVRAPLTCAPGNGPCSTTCTLTCPPDVVVDPDPGVCGAVVNYPAPATSGPCGPVACTPPSGSTFPVGTTTVTCTAQSAGVTCGFTVTVRDAPPPAPGSVDGATSVIAGDADLDGDGQPGYTYAVQNPEFGTTYDWTVSPGAAIMAGQGTSSVQVVYGANAGPFTVSVDATNPCGTASASLATAKTHAGFSWSFDGTGTPAGWTPEVGPWLQSAGALENPSHAVTKDVSESVSYGQVYGDFTVEASILALRSGPTKSALNTLWIHGTPTPYVGTDMRWNSGYAFSITMAGRYSIVRYTPTGSVTLQALAPPPAGATIYTDGVTPNVLRVVASGSTLQFFINGVLVRTLTGQVLSPTGEFGVAMARAKNKPTDVLRVLYAKAAPAGYPLP